MQTTSALVSLAIGLLLAGCSPESKSPPPPARAPEASTAPSAKLPSGKREPVVLLEFPASAYSATLHIDGRDLFLLTPHDLLHVAPDGKVGKRPFELGHAVAARHDEAVFHREGRIESLSWNAPNPLSLAKEKKVPERLAAADRGVFALLRGDDTGYRLQSITEGKSRIVYETRSAVATLNAKDDQAFLMESSPAGTFRLVRVGADGTKRSGPEHPGRTPSAVVVGERVYYYDGTKSEVRAASLDLEHERVLASDVICSPLSVGERIHCAYPRGITEISLDGVTRTELPVVPRGPITTLVSSEGRLLWLEDAGANRLVLKSLPLE